VNSAEPLSAEILAALLWDAPALRGGSRGAQAFADAFGPPPWNEPPLDAGLLAAAAHAVQLHRGGESTDALAIMRTLIEQPDGMLLSLCLTGWAAPPEQASVALHDAVGVVDLASRNSEIRARLLAKLAGLALDAHDRALYERCVYESIALAPSGSPLAWRVAIDALGEGIRVQEPPVQPVGGRYDALTWLPWTWGAVADAAAEIAKERVKARGQSTWSYTWRAGRTPLDQMLAAEAQAGWAGMRGIRRQIRMEIGAHLITDVARTRQDWLYALYAWITGGGRQIPQTVALAEPHLDDAAATELLHSLDSDLSLRAGPYALAEAADALWALIPDEQLDWVYEHVTPDTENMILAQTARRLWGKLCWRDPERFYRHWAALPEHRASEQLMNVQPKPLLLLSDEQRLRLLAAADEQLERAPDAELAVLAAELAESVGRPEVLTQIQELEFPTEALVELAGERPDLIDSKVLSTAISDLTGRVRRTREEAREGRVQFGSTSARVMLAQALALAPAGNREAVELLLDLAEDSGSPAQHMFEAREALVILKAAGLLDEQDRNRVLAMTDNPGTFLSHGEFTASVLAAQRRRILAPNLSAEDRTRLAIDTRDPDGRVRLIAILTAAIVLSAAPDQGVSWALLSGLFDPQDEIVQAALAAVARGALDDLPDARTVACERVGRLYEGTKSTVREAVVHAAAHLAGDSDRLQRLVADAVFDPSWRVRRAAEEASEKMDA
jgi:hypothetical protein